MALTFTLPVHQHKNNTPTAELEPLGMSYKDAQFIPPYVTDIKGYPHWPAELVFDNERSHRAAAEIIGALGQQGGIFSEMQKRLDEQDVPIIDPMALPSIVGPSVMDDPNYNWHRYDEEPARQAYRSLAEVAIYHEIPEMRPSVFSAEQAEAAFVLVKSAEQSGFLESVLSHSEA